MPLDLDQRARAILKRWFDRSGATQAEIASRIKRSQDWLSKYLSGRFNADLNTLDDLSRAFGRGLGELLIDDPDWDLAEKRLMHDFRNCSKKSQSAIAVLVKQLSVADRSELQPPPPSAQ